MAINKEGYLKLQAACEPRNVAIVAVSKIKTPADILELYDMGHRDFGENYVQELQEKYEELPKDIRWHFIGHLQRNKVKYIAPFIYLVQGVDSLKLLKEIDRQAEKTGRKINCLLQVFIAEEETKFGLDEKELEEIMTAVENGELPHVEIQGLMGMASFSDDEEKVAREFGTLKRLYDGYKQRYKNFSILSMGMTGDYKLAIEKGSNMVRVGSLIFGSRLA